MKRFLSCLVVAISVSACGSDESGSVTTNPTGSDATTTELETAPGTDAPIDRLKAKPIDCVIPGVMIDDSAYSTVAYEFSEPLCIGGWLLAASSNCEIECEGSFAFEMVDGEWQSRGLVYNVCHEGAVSSGLPEPIALYYVRSHCDPEGEEEMFLIKDESATGPLTIGDVGPRVAALDAALSQAGFLAEEPDDQFDYETLKAVLDLQFQVGLDVDGYAGPMTQGALGL